MPTVSIPNLADVLAWVANLPGALQTALLGASQDLAGALQQDVQDKLSGEVLEVRTGTLRDSISNSVDASDSGTVGTVFVDGDAPYAAIQEYGGTTKAHIIEAVNAKALSFSMNGKQSFFTRVNHPGSNIPERSYLRSSLDDMRDDILSGFADAASGLNNQ
jgi:phage gpG-like protein